MPAFDPVALVHSPWFFVALGVTFVFFVLLLGIRVIGEDESGLVVKRFGKDMPQGRIVARKGEAGYQAALLPPGWHFFLWRWQYKVVHVPVLVIPPGEIGLVVASDGAVLPPERILGREVECDHFQDAEGFFAAGGERGRQLAFLRAGSYRINPALFTVVTSATAVHHGMSPDELLVRQIAPECVGIVTTLDGHAITSGDVAGPTVPDHDRFQRGQAFIDAGGCRGLQEEILLSGSWNLNPWFVRVEEVPMTEVPIGYVGVVVSYVGREHVDVSGDAFTHGDLVMRGHKGVWVEPLLPGKHPINTAVMKVELEATTNIVLNWAQRTEAHKYDAKLSSIHVRSMDGFGFSLDVSQIIHVGMKNAPRVISRVGSIQNLVDHVLQPTVGNYFRNSAQEVTVLDFLSARSDRQREAFAAIQKALQQYDVECIDTLIGDISPPDELMKTQTDRKIADESRRTYEVQREAQTKRQDLERETAIADLQAEVVRSEQTVKITAQNALATVEAAKGKSAALKLLAEAEAEGQRRKAEAEADGIRATGSAKAEAYTKGIAALGSAGYTALQIAGVLAENHVQLVPQVSVASGSGRGDGGGSGSGLADVLIARMLAGGGDLSAPAAQAAPALPQVAPSRATT